MFCSIIFVKRISPVVGVAVCLLENKLSHIVTKREGMRIEIKGNSVLGSSYSPYRSVTSPRYPPYYCGRRVHLGESGSTYIFKALFIFHCLILCVLIHYVSPQFLWHWFFLATTFLSHVVYIRLCIWVYTVWIFAYSLNILVILSLFFASLISI